MGSYRVGGSVELGAPIRVEALRLGLGFGVGLLISTCDRSLVLGHVQSPNASARQMCPDNNHE